MKADCLNKAHKVQEREFFSRFVRYFISIFIFVAFSPFLLADDVITNVMSTVASYQFTENFGDEVLTNGGLQSQLLSYEYLEDITTSGLTNGGIMSPIISFQYYEWPGDDVLNLQRSPTVSYYYQFVGAPVLDIVSTTRTPTLAESSPTYLFLTSTPSQLLVYHGGIFTTNLKSIDPNQMTIVLTHGWITEYPLTGLPIFTPNGVDDWPANMAATLRSAGVTANIVAWDWRDAASSSLSDPKQAGGQTPEQGLALGHALTNTLGPNYSKPIHFIGHSFGTLVNAYAANFLQGTNFANEPVSAAPWPATNMQMTLFDEAETGANKDFNLVSQDLKILVDANANLLTGSPYYHPLPRQSVWADNYISAVGLLQAKAVNVILTNGFPVSAPEPFSWFKEFATFHDYPISWYEETIQNNGASEMGFQWSFENGGWFSQAPTNGLVYVQVSNDSQGDLVLTNWSFGTNFINARFQTYLYGVEMSGAQFVEDTVSANGTVIGQAISDGDVIEWLINLSTKLAISPKPQFKSPHPFGAPQDEITTNIPAYAWIQLIVPPNASSLSFDYVTQGDWKSDSLAAAIDGTNVLLLAGVEIQTNVVFNSGSIDVSTYAGQTNEFFVGIIGGTSTNAQLTLENLTFSVSLSPPLQVQMSAGTLALSWPLGERNFNLQTTLNLADQNSWMTLTNIPVIANQRCIITNGILQSNQFFRLVNQQNN